MKTSFLQSKLPDTGESIFTVMSSLALKHDAINLGQGFPDFDMNKDLIDLVYKSMRDGHNQYVHMNGLPTLRNVLAEKVSFLYDTQIDPEMEITITPGGTYAIYTALTTVLRPGDEVIVFEPAYDSYIPNIEINGAKPILLPLTYPDYKIDWIVVKENITPATRLIILNSPHNPTGSVLNKKDIEELRKIVHDTNILILSDEVYEHIIFDDLQHESMIKYPDLLERSFICFSFGKVYSCTGWKLGYCIAPVNLMNEFRKVHQYNCFSCNAPVQYALAIFLQQKNEYMKLGTFLQNKRDLFRKLMEQTTLNPLPSHGSYFQLYSYRNISKESEKDFAIRLTAEAGVASVPVAPFYRNGKEDKVLRFCFAKKDDTLFEAVKRLKKFENAV